MQTVPHRSLCLAALAGLALSAATLAGPAAGYSVEIFQFDPSPGTPESPPFTAGSGLNNHGHIIGTHGQANRVGFVYTPEDGARSLSTIFGVPSVVSGAQITDDGTVVGSYTDNGFAHFAFVGNIDGSFTALPGITSDPTLGAYASAINANGLIVGAAAVAPPSTFGSPTVAVTWQNGVIESLGTLGGDISFATGVNNAGVVVGGSNLEPFGFQRAFRWTDQGGMEELTLPTGISISSATGITDDGYIIGDVAPALTDGLWRRAAVWAPDGTVEMLDWVFDGTGALQVAEVFAMNSGGDFVGQEYHPDHGNNAVLWSDGEGVLLSDLAMGLPDGLELHRAVAINDVGQILVDAFDTVNQEFVSVLLTPVPAPSALAAFGVCGLAATRRRR